MHMIEVEDLTIVNILLLVGFLARSTSPAAGILDRRFGIAAPVVALLRLWLSHRFRQFALRHYTCASS